MKNALIILILLVLVILGLYFANSSKNVATQGPVDEIASDPVTSEVMVGLFAKKYSRSADDFVIKVVKSDGAFAQGSINIKNEPGGGMWFAAKTDKGWELAFDGNGMVTCQVANSYNFPSDIVTQCIDAENNNELINR